jgi:CRP/FNR family transcriptional regulator, nitrogen fixation regulation protein
MLTESTLQNAPSYTRSLRHEPPSRPGAFTDHRAIALTGPCISLRRNAEIYRENDRADHIYLVVTGTVRTCRVLVDGRRQIGDFYLPGEVFGLEIGSHHTFSAEAVVGAEVTVFKRDEMSTRMLALLGRELQRTQEHLLMLVKTAPERVAGFLLEMAGRTELSNEIELPMSRQDIADYLGLTIETVSRTLTQLESRSAIALPSSKRIVLRNRAALRRLNS